MSINSTDTLKKIIMYGASALALSSVAGVSIAQAHRDTYQQLSVKTHTGTSSTDPTPPVTKAAAQKDISKAQTSINKLTKALANAKTSKERKAIEAKIKKEQKELKRDKAALTKLEKTKSKKSTLKNKDASITSKKSAKKNANKHTTKSETAKTKKAVKDK